MAEQTGPLGYEKKGGKSRKKVVCVASQRLITKFWLSIEREQRTWIREGEKKPVAAGVRGQHRGRQQHLHSPETSSSKRSALHEIVCQMRVIGGLPGTSANRGQAPTLGLSD